MNGRAHIPETCSGVQLLFFTCTPTAPMSCSLGDWPGRGERDRSR